MKPKRLFPLLGAVALVIGGTSCTDYYGYAPSTKRGTVAGGLVGAGVGTIVGSQSDRPLEGAAIGGAIGALAGATLGSARDDERRYYGTSHYGTPHDYHRYEPAPYYSRPRVSTHYSFGYHYGYRPRYYGHPHRHRYGYGCRY